MSKASKTAALVEELLSMEPQQRGLALAEEVRRKFRAAEDLKAQAAELLAQADAIRAEWIDPETVAAAAFPREAKHLVEAGSLAYLKRLNKQVRAEFGWVDPKQEIPPSALTRVFRLVVLAEASTEDLDARADAHGFKVSQAERLAAANAREWEELRQVDPELASWWEAGERSRLLRRERHLFRKAWGDRSAAGPERVEAFGWWLAAARQRIGLQPA